MRTRTPKAPASTADRDRFLDSSMGAPKAHRSTPELLTLHAVRLRGMADDAEVADRFELDRSVSDELLLDFEAYGWVTRVEFAGTAAWMLTAAGRGEEERRLADELAATGAGPEVHDAYRTFLPLNGRLLKACTEWQLRPTPGDTLASNDHTDIVWDQRVLAELAALGDDLVDVGSRLSARLARFAWLRDALPRRPDTGAQRRAGLGDPAREPTPVTPCGWSCTRTCWPPSGSRGAPSPTRRRRSGAALRS